MAGNSWGTSFSITTFGESHGEALGVVIDGVEPGLPLTPEDIQTELDRRRPGQSRVTTPRNEPDRVAIVSGVFDGFTTGTPVTLLIYNKDPESKDYETIKNLFRPGHGDFSYYSKYGSRDYRGGGRSSGRETAARVAAGSIAKRLLKNRGISLQAYTIAAAGVACRERRYEEAENNIMRACDPRAAKEMEKRVLEAAAAGDSVGGMVECTVRGVPPGLGEPVFGKLDALLGAAVLSIGGVKGVEFGSGFKAAEMKGSQNNDQMDSSGFLTNHAGGTLAGISNGNDIVFRVAVKPTPSIAVPQSTQDINGTVQTFAAKGRHDPCLCPRIVPVIEAMAAVTVIDLYYQQFGKRHSPGITNFRHNKPREF